MILRTLSLWLQSKAGPYPLVPPSHEYGWMLMRFEGDAQDMDTDFTKKNIFWTEWFASGLREIIPESY